MGRSVVYERMAAIPVIERTGQARLQLGQTGAARPYLFQPDVRSWTGLAAPIGAHGALLALPRVRALRDKIRSSRRARPAGKEVLRRTYGFRMSSNILSRLAEAPSF